MSLFKLYSPVVVILIAALVMSAQSGVGWTVVFLALLAGSLDLHIKEMLRRFRNKGKHERV